MWVTLSNKSVVENYLEDDKEKHFTNKERKMVNQGFQNVLNGFEGKVVSEVFSPPRVAELAAKRGMKQGTSYDLITGWDLSTAENRRKMWSTLRHEKPELIIACPPCKMFSLLQELNFSKMPWDQAVHLIQIGLDDLELAALVATWQHRRGKYFVFEHPDGARSWDEECMQRLAGLPGVRRTRCDMCAYGMAVDESGFNLKPTGILTNSKCISKRLQRRCPRDHVHAPLMGGRAVKAQVYPQAFCEEIIKGIKDQIREDGGWSTAERYISSAEAEEIYAQEGMSLAEEDEAEEEDLVPVDQGLEEAVGERGGADDISPHDQAAILKLHKGVGHPALPDFVRFLKAARVRGEVVRWTSKNFKCESCEAKPRAKAVRPATIPKTYQPNKVIGIDLIYLPGVGGRHQVPALSILDWGSNYQMVEIVANKEPTTIWNTLWSCWARVFGLPEVVVCDAGKEFAADFNRTATANGIIVYQVGARAPWQKGRQSDMDSTSRSCWKRRELKW